MAGGPARIARHQDIHGRGAREALQTAVPTALLRLGGQVDRAVAQAAERSTGGGDQFIEYDAADIDTDGGPMAGLTLIPGLWLVHANFSANVGITPSGGSSIFGQLNMEPFLGSHSVPDGWSTYGTGGGVFMPLGKTDWYPLDETTTIFPVIVVNGAVDTITSKTASIKARRIG